MVEARPFVLLIVTIDLKVLFQHLVHSFSLTITFQMISGGKMKADVESFS